MTRAGCLPALFLWSIEGAIAHPEASRGRSGDRPQALSVRDAVLQWPEHRFDRLARAPKEIQNDSACNDVSCCAAAVLLRHDASGSLRSALGAGADGEAARRNQRPEFPARQQGAFRWG